MIPRRIPGTIRTLSYRFALWPRLTDDMGLIWFTTYQVMVWEVQIGNVCFLQRCVLGHFLNWFTRGWATRDALRGDGKVFMAYLPRER